jgi:hypothetical protein
VTKERTCKECSVVFTSPRSGANRGVYCSDPCRKAGRARALVHRVPPGRIAPNRDSEPLQEGGAQVACARCGKLRDRGVMCRTCEWRAFEEEAS